MKHIRIFETVDAFNAAKDSLAKPNIGLIEETGNSYVISSGSEPEVDYSKVAMFFENVDEQDVTIGFEKSYSSTVNLQSSTDGETWEDWSGTSTNLTKSVPAGGKLYVRSSDNVGYFNDSWDYNYFTSDGKVNVGGNIMSLGYKDFEDKTSITQQYAYRYVFNCMDNLVDASELVLPATTLAMYCYDGMFYNCTSLTTAPELPATELTECCYQQMFQNCSNLNYIKAMFITEPNNNNWGGDTYQWVDGVASEGTFVKNANATWDIRGVNGIPNGWEFKYNFEAESINDIQVLTNPIYANHKCIKVQLTMVGASGDEKTITMNAPIEQNETGSDVTKTIELSAPCINEIKFNVTYTQSGEENYLIVPMYFENISNNSVSINLKYTNWSAYSLELDYSRDGYTWTYWGGSHNFNSLQIPVGGKLYVRATTNVGYFNNRDSYYNYFTSDGKVNVGGNIMSLGYKDFEDKISITQNYAYYSVFYNMTNLVDASKLVLPATTLTNMCYRSMFQGCTSLTTAPELPATTLALQGYSRMFGGCTSLTTAPELPATTLAEQCYSYMFDGCSSLTDAPELPATTLARDCYYNMFKGCTSLTDAPELPATKLAYNCYSSMFEGCTSLTTAPELPATTLAYQCYYYMFAGCSSLTEAPELPATTLVDYCYFYMFYNCTSLTTAPELPATTLALQCYSHMFKGCSKLNYIKALFTTEPNNANGYGDTYQWVDGVASKGTFVKNANATWDIRGVNGIPEGWTVETATE